MRTFCHIDLSQQSVRKQEMHGEEIVRAGRHLIAKSLLELNAAGVDPLGPDNPLIFSAGPFGFALGQLHLAGFTLYGAADEWITIHLRKDGEIVFESAAEYMGMGNFDTAARLHEKYGKKTSIALCGPVGEYQGLLAGIAFSDVDLRPSRLSARGGVGAVMGSKKVKAIIVDLHKMPTFHDRKKLMGAVREYNKKLEAEPAIDNFAKIGTAMMADVINHLGGIPVRNFTSGQMVDTNVETFKLGGDALRAQNLERGGDTTHACMPGCLIQCSNVYADADGNEVVSPLEYETIGLLGTNCGLSDPDELAAINWLANDLGVDTIELGGTLGVLMEAGEGSFGDAKFMQKVLDDDLRNGTDWGKILAQGTARVGQHYELDRVPVIKGQTISAYDPRVVEVTGLTMMMTAQGADHTAGNLPQYESRGKDVGELVNASLDMQVICATTDSLGLCIFGRSVTNTNTDFIIGALNDAHGIELHEDFFRELGVDCLRMENEFNEAAGFVAADDELPAFFYTESLQPTDSLARFHSDEVRQSAAQWWQSNLPS